MNSSNNKGSEFYITEDSIPDDMVPVLTMPAENAPFNMDVLTLSEPPFSEKINSRMFYEEKTCKQCLDMLLHLSQYSDLVINVSGESGFGKTTLLYQALDRLGEKIFSSTFDASLIDGKEQLERELCDVFNVSEDSVGKLDFFESLEIHVESIARKFSSIVLLIDNAQEMTGVVLTHLSQLMNIKNDAGDSLLHLVLFSGSSIDEKLEQIFPGKLKTQKLVAYSRKDTGQYLRHRSNMAGMSLERYEEVFDAANILNIYTLSNGVPAKINELANNRLQEMSEKLAPSEKSVRLQSLSRRQLLSSVVILLLMATGWYFQAELKDYSAVGYQKVVDMMESQDASVVGVVDAEKNSTNSVLDSDSEKSVTQNDELSVTKVTSDIVSSPQDTVDIPEPLTADPVSQQPEKTVKAEEDDAVQNKQPKLVSESIPQSELQPVKLQSQAPVPQSAQKPDEPQEQMDQQVIEKVSVTTAAQPVAGLKSSTWLLEQDPQRFTIQVFGATDKQIIVDAVKKYKLLDAQNELISDVAMFQTKKKNRDWFSLVIGQYPDIESAKNASSKLPKVFVKGAWVRRNKSVQHDIGKMNSESLPEPLLVEQSSVSSDVRREKWLLSQNAQQYTLQLFGSNKEASIKQFIKTYQLDGVVAYFKTQKKGGEWFALTYGVFANRSDVKQAVSGLPDKLKKQVWIRKFAGVHRDIQRAGP